MKTFNQMSTNELLTSFNSGQGKTNDLDTGFNLAEFANVDTQGDTKVLTYGKHIATITNSFYDAEFLTLLHKDMLKKTETQQAKSFEAFSQGRLSLNHKQEEVTTVKPVKVLPGHFVTSKEWFEQHAIQPDFTTVIDAILSFDNVKSDSANKTAFIDDLKKQVKPVLPADKQPKFEELLKIEEDNRITIEILLKAGMIDIKQASETDYTMLKGIVDGKEARESVKEALTMLGYRAIAFDNVEGVPVWTVDTTK